MNILLEVPEHKVDFVMELLENLSFVKVKPVSPNKARLIGEIKEAVENMKLVDKGELKAQPLAELLNEL
jgi:hypothetical protein